MQPSVHLKLDCMTFQFFRSEIASGVWHIQGLNCDGYGLTYRSSSFLASYTIYGEQQIVVRMSYFSPWLYDTFLACLHKCKGRHPVSSYLLKLSYKVTHVFLPVSFEISDASHASRIISYSKISSKWLFSCAMSSHNQHHHSFQSPQLPSRRLEPPISPWMAEVFFELSTFTTLTLLNPTSTLKPVYISNNQLSFLVWCNKTRIHLIPLLPST